MAIASISRLRFTQESSQFLRAVRPVSTHAVILIGVDALMLAIAVLGGFFVSSQINPFVKGVHPSMPLAVLYALVSLAFFHLYPGLGMTAVVQMRRIYYGVTWSYLFLTGTMFVVREWEGYSRVGVLVAWFLSLLLVPVGRQVVCSRSWWGVPTAIFGAGRTGLMVIRTLNANRALGYRPVICLDDDLAKRGDCNGVPVVGTLSDGAKLAPELHIEHAIVAIPGMSREVLVNYLQEWSSVFANIVIIPDLLGVASLWVEPRDFGGVLGFEIRHNLLSPFNRWVKRASDLILSAVGLVIMFPILVCLGLWILIVSPGPVLYTQEREGRYGRPIRVFKLRTMYVNAESVLHAYLESNPDARLEWSRYFKLRRDPRILPGIGHFLRRTSLDELPQLWNVVKGEMSLVGPRPFPAYHNSCFSPEFRALRTQVTPGLTGLWQVSARSNGDLSVQESLDGYYIRNWSLWLDLYLLTRTVRAVISGGGAF